MILYTYDIRMCTRTVWFQRGPSYKGHLRKAVNEMNGGGTGPSASFEGLKTTRKKTYMDSQSC